MTCTGTCGVRCFPEQRYVVSVVAEGAVAVVTEGEGDQARGWGVLDQSH